MFCLRKLIIQSASNCAYRNFARHSNKYQDPGIGRRKKLVKLEHNEDITDFEDLESDFMEVHKSHKEYERELEALKEREKYLIVKQKYFKEKYPNFLTWHDKEQIRYLHRSDPEEWTIERLSEGFPALPTVIKKIAKSNYTKNTQSKISNHDESVQKNWNMFKEGKMPELPRDLVEHLNKFTNRALNFKPFILPESQTEAKVKINSTRTDFADIIKSYEKLKQPVAQIESESHTESQDKGEGKAFTSRKSLTLSQLHANLNKRAEMGKEIDEVEKHIVSKMKTKEPENHLTVVNPSSQLKEDERKESEKHLVDLSLQKYQSSSNVQNHVKKTEKDLSHLKYPDKISIPKKLFKKGFIYKLNDCYYDDDGEFLYRVPGMY